MFSVIENSQYYHPHREYSLLLVYYLHNGFNPFAKNLLVFIHNTYLHFLHKILTQKEREIVTTTNAGCIFQKVKIENGDPAKSKLFLLLMMLSVRITKFACRISKRIKNVHLNSVHWMNTAAHKIDYKTYNENVTTVYHRLQIVYI